MSWKCLPGGSSEQQAVRKMGLLSSLAWFLILDSLKLCTCFSGRTWFEEKTDKSILDRWCCKKEWQGGGRKAKGGVGVKGGWREGMSDTGPSTSVRDDVSQPLKGARSSWQQEGTGVRAQGLSFPFSGTNESCQAAATYWTQTQALFLSFSPHPELLFFGASTQTSSQTPLGAQEQPIQFLSYHPFLPPACFNQLGYFLTVPRECG